MDDLLPCPFCGNSVPRARMTLKDAAWIAHCFTCDCEGPVSDSEAGAVAAWNRRTSPPRPPSLPLDLTTQADAEIAILRSDLRAAQAATVVQIPDPCRPALTMTPAPRWVQGGARVPALVVGRGDGYVLVVTDGGNTVGAVPASEVK